MPVLSKTAKLNDRNDNVVILQHYLQHFGYLKEADIEHQGLFDNRTQEAVLLFQRNQGLNPTGELDEPTLLLMNAPRCGVADISTSSAYDGRWEKHDLTYGFINFTNDMSEADVRWAIEQALALWSNVSPLRFSEIPVARNPDIKILFAAGNHGDGDPFDGPYNVLAHAYMPHPNGGDLAGDVHFDESENWSITLPPERNKFDLITVAAHEFGHSLGLGHSNVSNALMYAAYNGPHRFLHQTDIDSIQAIYKKASKIIASGGEDGQHLSHAFADINLKPSYQGWGEAWILHFMDNQVAIECHGAEKGKYLSHAFGKIWLQDGYRGGGEAWIIHEHTNKQISIECAGGEKGQFLSHAHGKIWLQNGYKGAGELWSLLTV